MDIIEGLACLLVTERHGLTYVLRHTRDEVDELFTADEQKGMARAGALLRGTTRYVDMIAAARAVH